MLSARYFIVGAMAIQETYNWILTRAADQQRQKPLPEEVSDIYDKKRYQDYFNFVADKKNLRRKYKAVDFFLELLLIFSPVYRYIETWCGKNPYLSFLATYMLIWAVSLIPEVTASYKITFGIMEKYGMNKRDLKEFVKDITLSEIFQLILMGVFGMLITYIGEHVASWTNHFSIGYLKTILLLAAIAIVFLGFAYLSSVISYFVMRKQYTFTPLEDGDLRDKINQLQEGSRKKVKQIYVYNESKKTTTKNAFY